MRAAAIEQTVLDRVRERATGAMRLIDGFPAKDRDAARKALLRLLDKGLVTAGRHHRLYATNGWPNE